MITEILHQNFGFLRKEKKYYVNNSKISVEISSLFIAGNRDSDINKTTGMEQKSDEDDKKRLFWRIPLPRKLPFPTIDTPGIFLSSQISRKAALWIRPVFVHC
jgi:hypothetical protein